MFAAKISARQPEAVHRHAAQLLVRQVGAQQHGVPVALVHVVAGGNALEQLSLGNKLPEKPSYGGAAVIIVVAALFVILFIVGILAAILIPAYTEYTKHGKTHEISLSSEFSGFSTPQNVLKISKQEVNSGLNQFSEIVLIGEEVKKEA